MAKGRANFPQIEQDILDFWESEKIFEKSLKKKSPQGDYVFYDGPPFATGLPHYGHILASTIKDVIPRYWTMKGYNVRRVWGWDCHGLPIENIVEEKLKISGKKQIEEKGVELFNETCRKNVLTYANEWGKTVQRIGRWVDFKNSYKTMDTPYMESVWWAVKQIWEKGLLYEGRKVLLYCPRCETPISNFEVAMDNSYQDITEEAVFVKFKVTDSAGIDLPKDTFVMAWTTTPWTLPGNVALAVGVDIDYVLVSHQGSHMILAKDLFEGVLDGEYKVVKEFKGNKLEGIQYEPLFEIEALEETGKKSHYVTTADFVTTEDGTGIVHTAVVYGEDDYQLGLEKDLPVVPLIDAQGHFNQLAPEFLQGQSIKKVESEIRNNLEKRGLLYKREQNTHSYPYCWRCSTSLIYNAIPAWFINIQKIKDRLIELNEKINWYPDHLKHGRFKHGLESAPDWNISRNRYWATAIPIWKCENEDCDHIECIGSVEELRKISNNFNDVYGDETDLKKIDIHKPFIDQVELPCSKCDGVMRRITEVVDCWVESASMPFAELHAPFENQELFEKRYPAQFVAEYIAQTRAWFYVMHVMGTILFDKPPFENIVTTGTILNEKGEKLSKSKKNYPDPNEIIEKYGVDALRYYLMTSVVMRGDNLFFNEREVDEIVKKVLNLISNVNTFFQQYEGKVEIKDKPSAKHVLDAWILARFQELVIEVTSQMDAYDTIKAVRPIQDFINDLSTWYLRRSRGRFKVEGADQVAVMSTLHHVLLELSKLMAPFTPFIAERIYQDVNGPAESVHLDDWPAADKKLIDQNLLDNMKLVREIVSLAQRVREEQALPVKQVLASMQVSGVAKLDETLVELICDEVNVKKVKFGKGGDLVVELDTKITPELAREGMVREVTRKVNGLRKDAGLTIEDSIELYVVGDDEVKTMITEHADAIKQGTLASELREEKADLKDSIEFKANDHNIWVGIKKI